MKKTLLALSVLVMTGTAYAGVPDLSASYPGHINLRVENGDSGACQLNDDENNDDSDDESTGSSTYNGSTAQTTVAENPCMSTVARKTAVSRSKLTLNYVADSQAGMMIDIKGPHDRLWHCLTAPAAASCSIDYPHTCIARDPAPPRGFFSGSGSHITTYRPIVDKKPVSNDSGLHEEGFQ